MATSNSCENGAARPSPSKRTLHRRRLRQFTSDRLSQAVFVIDLQLKSVRAAVNELKSSEVATKGVGESDSFRGKQLRAGAPEFVSVPELQKLSPSEWSMSYHHFESQPHHPQTENANALEEPSTPTLPLEEEDDEEMVPTVLPLGYASDVPQNVATEAPDKVSAAVAHFFAMLERRTLDPLQLSVASLHERMSNTCDRLSHLDSRMQLFERIVQDDVLLKLSCLHDKVNAIGDNGSPKRPKGTDELHVKTAVVLTGLNQSSYNNQHATTEKWNEDKQRWTVRLQDGRAILVKQANLVKTDPCSQKPSQ